MRRDAHDGLHLRLSPNGGVPLWRVPVEPSSACLLTNKRRRHARSWAASFRRCMVDSNVEVRTRQNGSHPVPCTEGARVRRATRNRPKRREYRGLSGVAFPLVGYFIPYSDRPCSQARSPPTRQNTSSGVVRSASFDALTTLRQPRTFRVFLRPPLPRFR